jgi:deoxycytidine triphosphate deaminase
MILTGTEINKEHLLGNINILPFSETNINPNSYNYHLGSTIKIFDLIKNSFEEIVIPEDGFLLEP